MKQHVNKKKREKKHMYQMIPQTPPQKNKKVWLKTPLKNLIIIMNQI